MYPYQEFSELFPQVMVYMGPKIYGDADITAQQFRVLRIIGRGSVTVGEISNHINSKLSAAARLLRRMEIKGWIVKRQDEQDRRVFWLELTSEGRKFMETLGRRRDRVIEEMFERLSPEEQETIVRGIKLLLKSLAEE
ncbi:MarR family winged helix-turn-helix transcriptional regulator [Phosphitispora fastidiosa]|uniref:MarR family winged helix-turn-helix transcriptional regulator n=1 Tax=Phosphitispora fastidiosa TaxID=2837202 RepID=UPI001E415B3A|nr:MarR family transcriptional regulator [Phosphitispora fastidiosa]MBU7006501.1 DNA-binding MarR family transcriptional regulator [Phosphitispora fastidiosa]